MELETLLRQSDPQTMNRLVYALADTSYGECCIDDVTASHAANNDCIVHFGHTCLSSDNRSQTNTTKQVFYVLPMTKQTILDNLGQALQTMSEQILQQQQEGEDVQILLYCELGMLESAL